MILPIDARYRLSANRYGWAIERSRLKKGRVHWEAILWYTSLEAAVQGLGEFLVRTSDAQTLAEALAEVNRVSAKLCRALTPHVELKGGRGHG